MRIIKKIITLLSIHSTVQEEEVRGRHGGNPQTKPKNHHILQVYEQHQLFQVLYTYLDERQTTHYWKMVAFNITDRMVFNSHILYKENYRGPGKLKSRYK
jgi:hypothetical protein